MKLRKKQDLAARMTEFGIDVIRFVRTLPDDPTIWNAKQQLSRSATGIGANYREARRARSRAEFASKLQVALAEADESQHWLETIMDIMPRHSSQAMRLYEEAREITAILVVSSRKARRPI